MKQFLMKWVNVILIVGLIAGYNLILSSRAQAEEVLRLQAEVDSANLKLENVIEENEWLKENAALFAAASTSARKDEDTEENQEDTLYTAGTYTGEAQGFGGLVKVAVTVSDREITDITIQSADNEDTAYLTMAVDIIPAILSAQSADVDTISGATFSSTGIKHAVQQALEKAVN